MNQKIVVHTREASYQDHEAVVEHDETFEIQTISTQPADAAEVESLFDGEKIPKDVIFVWVETREWEEPNIADQHEPASVSDVIEWQGEFWELKGKRTFVNVLPHHKNHAVRVNKDDLEGLPDG